LLCRKCFANETSRFEEAKNEEINMNVQKMNIDENLDRGDAGEETQILPDLIKPERDYAIEKLNEVFQMFNLGPVVPYTLKKKGILPNFKSSVFSYRTILGSVEWK
jgi:hypothetical protein